MQLNGDPKPLREILVYEPRLHKSRVVSAWLFVTAKVVDIEFKLPALTVLRAALASTSK